MSGTHTPDRAIGRIALFIAVLSGFMTPFDLSAVNIALPAIGTEFAMDAVSLSWVSTAYLLASAIFLVPVGRVADIYGRKKVFSLGISIFTATSFALAFAPTALALIVLRFVQGAGAALIYGTAVAILTSVTPLQERGKVIGIYTTAVYCGLSLGPFLGGILTGYIGWQSIFFINVPIGLFAIWLIATRLHGEWAECAGEPFDLGGSVLYGATIVCVMYGFSHLPDPGAFALVAAGTLLLAAFILWEKKSQSPVLNIRLLARNRVFAFANLAALINYSATFAVTFFLSLYLQYVRGFSPQYAGLILVVQPVVMALLSPAAGRLADRTDPGRIASAGMVLSVCALILLATTTSTTSLPFIIASLVIMGIGLALFSSPNTTAIMGSVDRKFYGVASGTLGTMRLVGQTLSMGGAVVILAVTLGRATITPALFPAFLHGMQLAFLAFAILCMIGVIFSLVRVRSGEKHEA